MNSGNEYLLPPEARAYDHGSDTLLLVWPGEG